MYLFKRGLILIQVCEQAVISMSQFANMKVQLEVLFLQYSFQKGLTGFLGACEVRYYM